jgi:hypothetical protein
MLGVLEPHRIQILLCLTGLRAIILRFLSSRRQFRLELLTHLALLLQKPCKLVYLTASILLRLDGILLHLLGRTLPI